MKKISLFELLGWQDDFGVLLLSVCFILLLAPYLAGKDFGIIKIPEFSLQTKRALRWLGPLLFIACAVALVAPLIPVEISETITWFDNFSDGAISQARWLNPSDEALIYESKGVLNFVADLSGNVQGAEIIALPQGAEIREISFSYILLTRGPAVPGGVGVGLSLNDGQYIRLDAGPGTERSGFELVICSTVELTYDDCISSSGPSVMLNTPIPVRIVSSEQYLDFHINGSLFHRQPLDGKLVTSAKFFLYADPGSTFHATIDDLHFGYLD